MPGEPPASPTGFGESGGRAGSDASVKVNVFNMSAIDGNGLPSPGGGSATSPPAASTLGAGPTRLSANLTGLSSYFKKTKFRRNQLCTMHSQFKNFRRRG